MSPDDQHAAHISDRNLLEVAREWVHGIERAQLERRYLVDLQSGEVYREERARRAHSASVGPCPRTLEVGLAEVDPGQLPRRLRLLQYTISAHIPQTTWQQLLPTAVSDFSLLPASYQRAVAAPGSLAEPFVIVAPAAIARETRLALVDQHGRTLPLGGGEDDDTGTLRRFDELTSDVSPRWVAGRLVEQGGGLMLVPLAAGILRADTLHHERF